MANSKVTDWMATTLVHIGCINLTQVALITTTTKKKTNWKVEVGEDLGCKVIGKVDGRQR